MKVCKKSPKFKKKTIAWAVNLCLYSAILSGAIALSSPVLAQEMPANLTLEQAQEAALKATPAEQNNQEKDLRAKALQEAAQSYGARAGLAKTLGTINATVNTVAPHYDVIFNFGTLMLIDRQDGEASDKSMRQRIIVPPILTQADNNVHQESDTVFHVTGKSYKIFKQSHFSLSIPDWRNYLVREQGIQAVQPPHPSLLPRTDDERAKFKAWIAEGWEAGVKQAYQIHESDLNRLYRDFNGMVLYHELLREGKLSLPFVATNNMGVTGDDNSLNINDITLRITVLPAFNKDSQKWIPQAY